MLLHLRAKSDIILPASYDRVLTPRKHNVGPIPTREKVCDAGAKSLKTLECSRTP